MTITEEPAGYNEYKDESSEARYLKGVSKRAREKERKEEGRCRAPMDKTAERAPGEKWKVKSESKSRTEKNAVGMR